MMMTSYLITILSYHHLILSSSYLIIILSYHHLILSPSYQVYNQSRIVLRYVGHPEHRARDRNTSIGEWSPTMETRAESDNDTL